jgi:hypothetical protein
LRVGDVQHGTVIAHRWKIRASHNFFRVLLLFSFVFCDPHQMIVLQSQLHRFLESDVTSGRARALLSGCVNRDAQAGRK